MIVLSVIAIMLLSGLSIISSSNQPSNPKSYTISPFAQNTQYINNTFYINETIKDPLTGKYGFYGFDTNVVIGSTGTLIVSQATVYFLEDSIHPINLTVYGKLILNNATLTSVPDRLYPYVNFTLRAYNNAALNFNNSQLIYPGWFNVSNDKNVFANNTVFDKLSNQNLSLLSSYGFTGDINAVSSGPTPYLYDSTVHFTNVSFPHLFEYPAGNISTFAHVSSTTNFGTGIVITPSSSTTILANAFNSLLPNYVHDLTLTNATLYMVYNVTGGYNGTSYVTASINNSQTPIQSTPLLNYSKGLKSASFADNILFNSPNTIPISLNFLSKINNLILKITPPNKGTITLYSLTLNLSTDSNLLNFGFYKFNFNIIHSTLYGKNIFISANYNANTGNTLYNAIYLNQSSNAYLLNLTVTNSVTKLDPPYIIDSSSNIYIFRYANIKVLNYDGTPISNAIVSNIAYEDSQTMNNAVNNLNAQILNYFDYGSSYNITNKSGMASIPLLSDIIQTPYWPNSEYLGNYNFTVWTANYAKILIKFDSSLSYFPNLTVQSNNINQTVIVTIPNIKAVSIQTTPYFVQFNTYAISATFSIFGSSVNNVPVTFFINTPSPTYLYATINMVVGVINTATVNWTVPSTVYGNYTITATDNSNKSIFETNYTDNSVSSLIKIYPKIDIGVSQIVSSSTLLYQNTTLSFNIFNNGWDIANNVLVSEQLLYPNGSLAQKNITLNLLANSSLPETIVYYASMPGNYSVQVDAHYYWDYNQSNNIATKTYVQSALITAKPPALVIPWLLIIIVVIIAAVGGFLGYTFYSYKKVEKNVMVCGNCGSIIKADAEKCPVCGIVFEKDKVKCSECGEWINTDAKYCTNCGALFIKKEDTEYEYLSTMKQKYDAFIQRFKDEAKRDLGEKYAPEEFTKWWQAKNEYLSFEAWLKQQEEQKQEMVKCPVCGSLNPKTEKICHVCGSSLVTEKKEEKPPEAPPSGPREPAEEKKEEQVVKKRVIKRIIPGEREDK